MQHPNIFVLALLFLLTGAASWAQGSKPHGHGDLSGRFGEELQLTEDQQSQLQELQDQLKADLQAIREQSAEDPAKRREAARERMNTHRQAVEALLTEEQRTLLREKTEEHREQHRKRMAPEGLRSEMKTYREEKVLPVLMEQRTKLEEKISPEDKQTIAELRTLIRKEHERRREDKSASSQDRKERSREKEETDQLKALVEKYEPEIETLLAEIEPQREKWVQDLRGIHEKYRPENDGEIEKREGEQERSEKKSERRAFISKRHFLLLDPNTPAAHSGIDTPRSGAELKVFPNPAVNSNRIGYTVRQAGKVRIELLDKEGRLVNLLLDEHREPGDYTLDVDLSRLNDGIYYYTISDQQGKTTRKVVVSKN